MADALSKNARYFLQEHLVSGPVRHGGIGNKDIETVLIREGWLPIHPGDQNSFSWSAKWRRLRNTLRWVRKLPKGATVLFQWPLYAGMNRLLVRRLLVARKDIRLVCFLTDINGLKDGDEALLKKEVAQFRKIGSFIVHNESMREWLRTVHPEGKSAAIDFFDFLAAPATAVRVRSTEVCFAGNLAKSPFICELPGIAGLHFHLYGEPVRFLPVAPNCSYEGAFEPAQMPGLVRGAFGLVWDGESSEGHTGSLGDYARWISPHKLSLYILAGMPLICHAESAAARLAAKYGIGFSAASLHEVPEKIAAISDDDYEAMCARMRPLAALLSGGLCLPGALEELGCSTSGARL